MRLFLLSCCLLFLQLSTAQTVINTEELRLGNEGQKVVGMIDADFGLTRNKAGLYLKPGLDVRLELLREKSRLMLLGGYALTRFTDIDIPGASAKNFTNRGFGHLRYNYHLSEGVTWEAFVQSQFDEVQEIDSRWLLGTGPRFRLLQKDDAFLFTGLLYMYEYEKTSAEENAFDINRDHRLSTYFSGGIQFNPFVSVSNTSYFQPNLLEIADYRVSSVTDFTAQLSEKLALETSFSFVYDNQPPLTVPKAMYDVSAGIKLVF